MSRKGLAEAVLERVKPHRTGFPAWHEKLSADDRKRLEEIRSRWAKGDLQITKNALARAIIEECRERGIVVSGIQGVTDWLNLANGRRR